MPHDNPRLARNNFDLLRLLFAAMVCLVHSYELSGFPELAWVHSVFSGPVAVKCFFVVSGFLIFMSYERSSSLQSYARKRLRRIYPAYFTVIVLCAVGLLAVSTESPRHYFSAEWVKYLLANLSFLSFLQPTLPGVFDANQIRSVNGAIWTLKVEMMFYLSVPVFVLLFRRFARDPLIVATYLLSVVCGLALAWMAARTGSPRYVDLARQLPAQLCYFMAGAFLYYHLDFFERHVRVFVSAAVACLMIDQLFFPLAFLEPFALGVLVIFFALFLYVGNFGRYGDFSYGTYILHFPIVQLYLLAPWSRAHPWLYLLAVVLTTGLAAVAMWHLVEKRFLFRSSHYVASSAPA